jgi:hypothetical protein
VNAICLPAISVEKIRSITPTPALVGQSRDSDSMSKRIADGEAIVLAFKKFCDEF